MKKFINKNFLRIIFCLFFFLLSLIFSNNIFSLVLLIFSYLIISYPIYIEAFNNLQEKEFFDENLLMIIATLGAFIIKSYEEAVMVMLLFEIGEYLSDLAVSKSKSSITSLLDLRVDTVNIITDQETKIIPVKDAKLEDVFIVKPGERIPLDGLVIEGTSFIDTYPLTGESLPKKAKINDQVLGGCINRDSLLKIKATSTYTTTTAARIIKMLESSDQNKSKTETFFSKFAKIYTPIIVCCALILAIVPTIITKDYQTWLYRSLVFLVTSCPCALVISIPLGYFCGIGAASKKGILIKGSKELDNLTNLDYLILDKTGTLTEGVFEVTKVKAYDISSQDLIKIVASAEENSLHPIATAIKSYNHSELLKVTSYQELPGLGISCIIDKKKVLIGNEKLMRKNNIPIETIETIGTTIYISINNKYSGYIIISDKVKSSSKVIPKLKKYFKDIIILSGDNEEAVKNIAKKLSLKTYHGNLLPEDKLKYIKEYQKQGKVLFIGDGINDAPVLKQADIGISMGQVGSDAAIETSDIVLMKDDLNALTDAFILAKYTKRKVLESIIFALIIKILVLLLALFGISTIWMAVFADVGVTFLAILNVLLIIIRK